MILILSFSYFEQGTDPVIDWLLYYKVPFIKIAVEDLLNKKNKCRLDVNTGRLYIDNNDVTDVIKVIFFRRFYRYLSFENKEVQGDISRKIFYESNSELKELTDFLFKIFEKKTWFPIPGMVAINKLEVTYIAHKLGLKTPDTVIVNNKDDLLEFYKKKKGQVITKPIGRISYYTFGKYTYNTYTIKLTEEIIENLPHVFFPTQLQEAVKEHFEIRIFYIDGEFYSTAAISNNYRREVDLKRSFNTKDLHWVPYMLPNQIEQELKNLMQELNLVTGSIDVILDIRGNYHFIEVNPVGQYLAPSHQSNYYIEKIIAEWLIAKNKEIDSRS